jgi:ATP-dependent DNA helicase RecQ
MNEDELLAIDGVGKAKLEKYGSIFINAVIDFHKTKAIQQKKASTTYKETLTMLQSGLTVEEIAEKRNLGLGTIMSHLAKLYEDGLEIDLYKYVTKEDVQKIAKAKSQITFETPNALKPYFDYFEEQISYDKIRLSLAILSKEKDS